MKRIMLLLMVLMLSTGCTQQNEAEPQPDSTAPIKKEVSDNVTYIKITTEDAKDKMGQEGVIILDVRTPAEYAEGHIPGALLLPVDQIEEQALTVLPDQGAEILVYCRSGNRSKTASKALIEMGYTKVFDFGGIIDWPYETAK